MRGGELSSDSGLLLLKEFNNKMGFCKAIGEHFQTNDDASFRYHKDDENLLQMVYQIQSAYFEDDCADELTNDPIFTSILEKPALASQPTLSRFHNRMDGDTLSQFDEIGREFRRKVYSVKPPKMVLFDIDTTLLETYGKQEGEAFNYHYKAHGYHPYVCYDGLTGDLLRAQLRKGADYCSNGVCEFMQPLFDEFLGSYPDTALYLRGDSGFATPGLYTQCETNGTSYVIRLKENATLRKLAAGLDEELTEITRENMAYYAVAYNIFNWFRRLALPDTMRKLMVDTIWLKLMKIASRLVSLGGYKIFKLASGCPYKEDFHITLYNIRCLMPHPT